MGFIEKYEEHFVYFDFDMVILLASRKLELQVKLQLHNEKPLKSSVYSIFKIVIMHNVMENKYFQVSTKLLRKHLFKNRRKF